jgi:hypothetical protein
MPANVLFRVPDNDMDSHVFIHKQRLVARYLSSTHSPTLTLMLVGYGDHDLGRLERPTKVDEKPPPSPTTPPKTSTFTLAVLIAAAVCLTFHLLHPHIFCSTLHSRNPLPLSSSSLTFDTPFTQPQS